MLFTDEEYKRGIVRWQFGPQSHIVVEDVGPDGERRESTLTSQSGSVIDFLPSPSANLRIVPVGDWHLPGAEMDTFIFVEREQHGEIVTSTVLPRLSSVDLCGIPGPGSFTRLTAITPTVLPPSSFQVIRTGDVAIRFRRSSVLMRSSALHDVDGNQLSLTILGAEQVVDGPTVEIVVPSEFAEDPSAARSILALVYLAFENSGAPEIVQEDSIVSTPRGAEYGVLMLPQEPVLTTANRIPRMPASPTEGQLRRLDCLLSCVIGDLGVAGKALVPLRWYLKGLTSRTDLDRFAAAFIGIEGIVTAHSRERGTASPLADAISDPQVPLLLDQLRKTYSGEVVDRLTQRLLHADVSLLDHLEALSDILDVSPKARRHFNCARAARGDILHGRDDGISSDRADWAIGTLGDVLLAILLDSGCSCED